MVLGADGVGADRRRLAAQRCSWKLARLTYEVNRLSWWPAGSRCCAFGPADRWCGPTWSASPLFLSGATSPYPTPAPPHRTEVDAVATGASGQHRIKAIMREMISRRAAHRATAGGGFGARRSELDRPCRGRWGPPHRPGMPASWITLSKTPNRYSRPGRRRDRPKMVDSTLARNQKQHDSKLRNGWMLWCAAPLLMTNYSSAQHL
jgi:hypothetical protein